MATKQIIDFTEKTSIDDGDFLIMQTSAGGAGSTGKIKKGNVSGIITTNTILTVGTGGTYPTITEALAWLNQRTIQGNATVTIQLVSNLTGQGDVVWAHPQSENIVLDFNGYNYQYVGGGTAFTAERSVLRVTTTGTTSVITATNPLASCFKMNNGRAKLVMPSGTLLTIGASGAGFTHGVFANIHSLAWLTRVNVSHCTAGCFAQMGSAAFVTVSTFSNNTQAIVANVESGIYVVSLSHSGNTANYSPALNTVGNFNSIIVG